MRDLLAVRTVVIVAAVALPARATDPVNRLGDTPTHSGVDTPPTGKVFFDTVVGHCPSGQIVCGGVCDVDSDADTFCDHLDNCPNRANTDQVNRDGDQAGDVCDYKQRRH